MALVITKTIFSWIHLSIKFTKVMGPSLVIVQKKLSIFVKSKLINHGILPSTICFFRTYRMNNFCISLIKKMKKYPFLQSIILKQLIHHTGKYKNHNVNKLIFKGFTALMLIKTMTATRKTVKIWK